MYIFSGRAARGSREGLAGLQGQAICVRLDLAGDLEGRDHLPRTDRADLNARALHGIGSELDLSLNLRVRPLLCTAAPLRFNLHVERMRLINNGVSSQVVGFRHKPDSVHASPEPVQLDREPHLTRRNRLVICVVWVHAKLGWHPCLVNRDFKLKVATREETLTVRPSRVVQSSRLFGGSDSCNGD